MPKFHLTPEQDARLQSIFEGKPMLIEMGVGWVPTPGKPGNVPTATPGEYVAEIERLRAEIAHLESLLDPAPEAVAAWVEVLNDERDQEITKLRAERDAAAREATILRSAIKDYLSGDYENPRKHRAGGPQERCDHGRYYWEVCDSCADAHFERALALLATDQTGGE